MVYIKRIVNVNMRFLPSTIFIHRADKFINNFVLLKRKTINFERVIKIGHEIASTTLNHILIFHTPTVSLSSAQI